MRYKLALILLFCMSFAGCTSTNLSSSQLSSSEAKAPAMIKRGTIVAKRLINVKDIPDERIVGSSATVGAVAGASLSGGSGLKGALVGGTIGFLAANFNTSEQQAIAYTVELENKKLIRVASSIKDDELLVGDAVFLEYSSGFRVLIVKDISAN